MFDRVLDTPLTLDYAYKKNLILNFENYGNILSLSRYRKFFDYLS